MNIYFKKTNWLKISTIFLSTAILTACQSVHYGSLESRSAVLSSGIQKAYSVNSATANRVSPLILQNAARYDIDPLLISAVIRQESSYRSNATSPAGAVGLIQVIPRYWLEQCPGNLYDEATNIQCGAYILSNYKERAGSWPKALAYYNVGPTGYQRDRKMKKQGKKYAKQVKQHQKELKRAI